MIKLELIETAGLEPAVRGMRNPHNSWDKSDSGYKVAYNNIGSFKIGEKDMELAKKLVNGGAVHRKFMRQIVVWVDITAPLYWWKEFDTYKVGTVSDSCSTMHTIHKNEITYDNCSCEHLDAEGIVILGRLTGYLNSQREQFIEDKDKEKWYRIIQLLPQGFNQKRTIMMSYEVLLNIYKWRSNHKLDEWREFCEWCDTLPYFKELRLAENG